LGNEEGGWLVLGGTTQGEGIKKEKQCSEGVLQQGDKGKKIWKKSLRGVRKRQWTPKKITKGIRCGGTKA